MTICAHLHPFPGLFTLFSEKGQMPKLKKSPNRSKRNGWKYVYTVNPSYYPFVSNLTAFSSLPDRRNSNRTSSSITITRRLEGRFEAVEDGVARVERMMEGLLAMLLPNPAPARNSPSLTVSSTFLN